MGKTTIKIKVTEKLRAMKKKESFNKHEFALEIYDEDNYFTIRSLDVHICHAKKLFPKRQYKCIDKRITRTY